MKSAPMSTIKYIEKISIWGNKIKRPAGEQVVHVFDRSATYQGTP